MNYKVDESTLMAYLYGELGAEEQEQVKQHLDENPASQEMLKELGKVRTMMGKLEDQEPIGPLVLDTHKDRTIFRRLVPWLGAAAAVSLLLLVGYATDLSFEYQDNKMTLAFGEPETTATAAVGLTQEQLVPLLEGMLVKQKTQYSEELQAVQSTLENQINTSQQLIAKTNLKAPTNGLDDRMLQAYLAQHQQQNIEQVAQLLQNNTQVQRENLQVFLAEYHQFLEERRLQDLQLIEAGFLAMQNNVDQQKSETEQILANIITSVNSTNY